MCEDVPVSQNAPDQSQRLFGVELRDLGQEVPFQLQLPSHDIHSSKRQGKTGKENAGIRSVERRGILVSVIFSPGAAFFLTAVFMTGTTQSTKRIVIFGSSNRPISTTGLEFASFPTQWTSSPIIPLVFSLTSKIRC